MVTVHGEIPVAETPALQTFLASDDDRPLRDDPFWTRSYQDGRTSEAVLGLLRKLAIAGAACRRADPLTERYGRVTASPGRLADDHASWRAVGPTSRLRGLIRAEGEPNMNRVALALILLAVACGGSAVETATSSSAALEAQPDRRAALFEADAAHTAAIERLGPVDGVLTALRGNAVYLTPGKDVIRGRNDIRESLVEENPDADVAQLTRTLLGGDVSADGNFGFTYGWLLRTAPTGAPYGAYVAVWEREDGGEFRVTAYFNQRSIRRVPQREGFPLLAGGPGAGGVPHPDGMEQQRRSVMEADSAFAALSVAQGASVAFPTWANQDWMMIFGGNFIGLLSHQEIVDAYAGSTPSEELNWAPLYAGASASGDLGFTVGNATSTIKGEDGSVVTRSYSKYLTLWARTADGSWRFIADGGQARPAPQP